TIVSVDGGCQGVRNVKAGVIDATSQQYPLKMASLGVDAVVKYAKGGAKASGYTDTGVNLIAKKAVEGVPSKSVAYGLANCGGQPDPPPRSRDRSRRGSGHGAPGDVGSRGCRGTDGDGARGLGRAPGAATRRARARLARARGADGRAA